MIPSTADQSPITTAQLDEMLNASDDVDAAGSDVITDSGVSTLRIVARRAAVVVFVLSFGMLAYPKVVSPVIATRNQALAEDVLASSLYNGTAPLGGDIVLGTPVALLEIPSIGLRRAVVEGTTAEQLAVGPGHLVGSVLPGQYGVSAILGRSTNFGADFELLRDVKVGDEITATTGQGVSTYEVLDITRRADTDQSAFVGEGNMLLLMTSTGGSDADGRLVVRASLTSTVMPVGDAVSSTTSSDELGLSGSSSAAVDLVFWSLLLLALSLVLLPARRFFGSRVAWMVAAPVVGLAVLQVMHQLALLMPSMF